LPDKHHPDAQLPRSQNTAFNLGAGRVVSAHGVNSNCDHRIYPTALSGRPFLDGIPKKKGGVRPICLARRGLYSSRNGDKPGAAAWFRDNSGIRRAAAFRENHGPAWCSSVASNAVFLG